MDPADRDEGVVILVATPIGNLADASARLRETLAGADVIAAEDTRRARRLLADLDLPLTARLVSYYDAVEQARAPELAEAARSGACVVVVSDAGMPAVSDPGYRIVAAAAEAGVRVTAVPGPSAAVTALALSGMPSDRFCFEGFLPRKAGERASRVAALAEETRTMVFFEAPHRAAEALEALVAEFGPHRRAAACRELTKTYEEVRRGTLDELREWAQTGIRGEVTLVVAGADEDEVRRARGLDTTEAIVAAVAEAEAAGVRRKDAIADIARRAGVPRREVYDAVVREARP